MELDKCITERRSTRKYQPEPIPKAIVDKILNAGVWAPSGMNLQPWRFMVIQDRNTINKLSERVKQIGSKLPLPSQYIELFKSKEDTIFYGAPLPILVCVPMREDNMKMVNYLDCGLAAQNMLLTAYQEGLGSCFIGFASFLNQDPEILEEVGVPRNMDLLAPLIFGYPADIPRAPPREIKILKWIQ